MNPGGGSAADVPAETLKLAPVLEALRDGPLDRGDLEARLDVSRATSHRYTRSLGALGLIDRIDGAFRLTAAGESVADAAATFRSASEAAVALAPVAEASSEVEPLPLEAFVDAVVTSARRGDPHAPGVRFAALVAETDALRGFDTWSIAPTYAGELQRRILDGMETTLVDPADVVEDVMANYPERCVRVCASGNLEIRLHDDLPFGLAIFDDRIGVAVRDPDSGALESFVDADAPAARDWAETVYRAYEGESARLEHFTRAGLREATSSD